jgi:pyrroloquinoline-quinone synthase
MLHMDIIQRIDSEIEKRSLLKHPFYQMWSEGKLTIDHLSGYTKEYFQLVKAVPGIVENIASLFPSNQDIATNAKDESDHVAPWVRFASALGVEPEELASYKGDKKANAAVEMMKKLSLASFEEAVAAMYAYEAELPKISRTKLDGLVKFYQLDSKDALEYFQIHEEADVRHAQVWREVLQAIPENRHEAVFNAAVESLAAQNLLLDSVQEKYVR